LTIFVDRCYSRNNWYVINNGTFIAGPFSTKGEAIQWKKTTNNRRLKLTSSMWIMILLSQRNH